MLRRNLTASLAALALALGAAEAGAAAPGASCASDEFSGPALDSARWTVLRPAGTGISVSGGRLRLDLRDGAMAGSEATARNVVLEHAPSTGWTATARLGIAAVDAPGERAGLVLWRSEGTQDNTFATATFARTGAGAARFEAAYTDGSVAAVPLARNVADAPAGLASDADVLLRLRSDGTRVSASYSADDGVSWTPIGSSADIGGPVRVGMLAIGTGGAAAFDRFTLSCGPDVELHAAPDRGTATLEVGANAHLSDDVDDEFELQLAWDFGDGTTGRGGQARLHKYSTPGMYRLTLRATDADGNVTSAARTVDVLRTDPACPAGSDEFDGNWLHPRWRPLRPVPTGVEVHGGRLWLRPYAGALLGPTATARNVVMQPAPAGPWTMTTAVDVAALDAAGDRAGLVLWRGEAPNDFAQLALERAGTATKRLVLETTSRGAADTAGATGPAADTIHLRVVSDGALPPTFTALHSADGMQWTPLGRPFGIAGDRQLQVGPAAMGSSISEPAGFEYLRLEGTRSCGAPDTLAPETTHVLEPGAPDPTTGAFHGPVRVTLASVDDAMGSGVDRTEYRIGSGSFGSYDAPFTLTAPAGHVVEYRSIDRAGNVEASRRLHVVIAAPPRAPAEAPPAGEPPAGRTAPPDLPGEGSAARGSVRILAPARKQLRTAVLARRGLLVRASCRAVTSARIALRVGPRAARRLGSGRRTLAARIARCGPRMRVRLLPRTRVRRALGRLARPIRATIEIRAAGAPGDRRRVVFR